MNRAANRLLSLLALVPLACSSTTAAPVITAFAASPATIGLGQSSTLSWTASGASTLSIDQGVGVVTGTSVLVSPAQTLRYTLTASNDGGVSTATATVTVSSGTAQILSFTATPAAITAGLSTTLAWSVTGAASLSIDNGVGDVSALTQISASPAADTTYTLTARDANGIATVRSVTVSVHAAGAGIYYTDPPATLTSARQISLVRNAASTPTRAIIDVKTGSAGVSAAFGVALNLPLGHTLATFNSASGILVPANPVLDPGTGTGRTAAGKVGVTGGPLSDVLTLGFARLKTSAATGNVALPPNTVLFSIAFDLVSGAPAATLFDGTFDALPASAKLAVLSLGANSVTQVAVPQSGFAVGRLYTVTQ